MARLIRATRPEPRMVFVGEGDPLPEGPPIGMEAAEEVQPRNGVAFDLEELYEMLGVSMIECLTMPDGKTTFVIDEEGKLNGSPANVEATMIYRLAWAGKSDWASRDTLMGNVLICETTDDGEMV